MPASSVVSSLTTNITNAAWPFRRFSPSLPLARTFVDAHRIDRGQDSSGNGLVLHIRRRFCPANQYDNAFAQLTSHHWISDLRAGFRSGLAGARLSRFEACTAQCGIAGRGTWPGPPHHLRRQAVGLRVGGAGMALQNCRDRRVAGGQRRPCAARRFSGAVPSFQPHGTHQCVHLPILLANEICKDASCISDCTF